MSDTDKTIRVQFDFTSSALYALDDLVEVTKVSDRATTVRNSLKVYQRIIAAAQRGDRFIMESPDGTRTEFDPF